MSDRHFQALQKNLNCYCAISSNIFARNGFYTVSIKPRCRTSQYRRTFILLSASLWSDLVDPVFDGVGLAGFKSRSNAFLLPRCSLLFYLQLFSLYLLFLYRLVVWGWGLRTNRVSISSPGLALPIFLNNNNNK